MSKNLENHIEILKFLSISSNKTIKILLNSASDSLIFTICEICLNLCQGKLECDKKLLKNISRFRKFIHFLAKTKRSSKSLNTQRKILKKFGVKILKNILPLFFVRCGEQIARKSSSS